MENAWLDLKRGLPVRQDKGEKIIPHIGIIPKVIRLELFLDHYGNHIQTFQETLETASAMMRILTRAQPKRLYTGIFVLDKNIYRVCGMTSAEELDTMSKNNSGRFL